MWREGVDRVVASGITLTKLFLCMALPFGFLVGFIAACPANALLVRKGIEHGIQPLLARPIWDAPPAIGF